MSTFQTHLNQPLESSAPLILVTDDDDIMRTMVYETLIQLGYRVIQASSGQDCLKAYLHYSPDLVLLDLEMPEMNGIQCCQELRSLTKNDLSPILIMSASTHPEAMEQAFAAGATDYLTKPISWPIFKQRVQQALQTKQTIADLERQLQQERSISIALKTQLREQTAQHIQLYQSAQAQTARLERLNQLKDSLLNTASHELRSPLTNMSLAIQMLEQQLQCILHQAETLISPRLNLHKVFAYLKILRDQCQREIHLINNLLDLKHLEAGEHPLFPELFDLPAWLPSVMGSFAQRVSERQQILQIQIAPDLPSIKTDPSLLERILTELLTNACKYTPPNATITVTAQKVITPSSEEKESSSFVQICVSNTGVEIPVEALSRIFDPFYRVPKGDRWKQGGSGLGLTLVQKMAQRLQGTIQVSSANSVTQFIVELPFTLDENESGCAIVEPTSIKTHKPAVKENV